MSVLRGIDLLLLAVLPAYLLTSFWLVPQVVIPRGEMHQHVEKSMGQHLIEMKAALDQAQTKIDELVKKDKDLSLRNLLHIEFPVRILTANFNAWLYLILLSICALGYRLPD